MKPLIFAGILTLLTACGTYAQLTPRTLASEKLLYVDGQPLVISSQKNAVGVVIPSGANGTAEKFKYKDRIRFVLFVTNRTTEPFEFSSANVGFQVKTEPQKVYSYNDLLDEQRSRDTWRAIAVGLSAFGRGMSAASAGYSHQSGTVAMYGSGGYATGTYSGTTYDSTKAAIAQQQASEANSADIARAAAARDAEHAVLEQTILKQNTILPGQTVSGSVVANLPSPDEQPAPVMLLVSLPGETHKFEFSYSEHP